METKPVCFEIGLKTGADWNSVKRDLEALAGDFTLDVFQCRRKGVILGSTSQETYERVFHAELKYVTKTIPNVNRGPYDVQEWNEITGAVVPENLRDRIDDIQLDRPIYLTD